MSLTLSILFWELELYRNSRRDRESVRRRNRKKFANLLRFVQQHSPYYARIMRERRLRPETATPEDFPVMSKNDLIENFDEIVTSPEVSLSKVEAFLARSRNPGDLLDGRYVIVHSSGTSGRVCYCAYSKREWIKGYTSFFRAIPVFGPIPRRTAFVGAVDGHFAAVSLAQTLHWLKIGIFGRTRVFDVNLPWNEIVDGLNRMKPHNLSCYGSLLGELAAEQEKGALNIQPRCITCGGDPLPASDRRTAERVFGRPVLDIYATTETMILGISEPKSQGMVLLEDDLWTEVQPDRLLVTNLFNRTTPLIRYAIPDALRLASPKKYDFYRGYRRIQTLAGRNEDRLYLVNEAGNEDFIHPNAVVEFFVPGITAFQVIRTGQSEFVFRVKLEEGQNGHDPSCIEQETRAWWNAKLATKRMRNVRFDVEFVDQIKNDPRTRKFRLVSDHRSIPAPVSSDSLTESQFTTC